MSTSKEYEQFMNDLFAGKFSQEEKRDMNAAIVESIRLTRAQEVAKKKRYLSIGDTVIIQGISPKKLNGTTVTIKQIKKSRIVADIPGIGETTIPISCIQQV